MEGSVTCKVQVVPMDPSAPPGGGDAQKGLKAKSLSQGKLVQVILARSAHHCLILLNLR